MHASRKFASLALLFLLTFSGWALLAKKKAPKTDLNVPFTSQAPTGDWSEPWQNACEQRRST